jgi:hypothetical protein
VSTTFAWRHDHHRARWEMRVVGSDGIGTAAASPAVILVMVWCRPGVRLLGDRSASESASSVRRHEDEAQPGARDERESADQATRRLGPDLELICHSPLLNISMNTRMGADEIF